MVKVRRIVPDLAAGDPKEVAAFYRTLFDLDILMDQGWIVTLGAQTGPVQISIAAEGGSGAPVPHLSIEVDDVSVVYRRALENEVEITYPLTKEPWGVHRFFLRDPTGKIVNVLSHS
ncbi:MAG: glyoxalase [Sulfitobacter sp.]|nr:glyoxalase [Sulfitobacter sp.]